MRLSRSTRNGIEPTFFGGNATMAVWLWEQNGRRCNAAIAASVGNALMCLGIIAVIAWTRL